MLIDTVQRLIFPDQVHGTFFTDSFSEIINIRRPLPPFISSLTGITDAMIAGGSEAEDVLARFLDFTGDSVITSGKGGAFPSGIIVGTVTELRSEAGGQNFYAVVDPAVDLSLLSQVFIIKDFEVIE